MNSIYFFYKIFNLQELVLKFNNLHYDNIITLEKCILFKPQPKEVENDLNVISNDLRYIFEFLTNSKVTKSINKKFICFNKTFIVCNNIHEDLTFKVCISHVI